VPYAIIAPSSELSAGPVQNRYWGLQRFASTHGRPLNGTMESRSERKASSYLTLPLAIPERSNLGSDHLVAAAAPRQGFVPPVRTALRVMAAARRSELQTPNSAIVVSGL
jgi:hypothetical protein